MARMPAISETSAISGSSSEAADPVTAITMVTADQIKTHFRSVQVTRQDVKACIKGDSDPGDVVALIEAVLASPSGISYQKFRQPRGLGGTTWSKLCVEANNYAKRYLIYTNGEGEHFYSAFVPAREYMASKNDPLIFLGWQISPKDPEKRKKAPTERQFWKALHPDGAKAKRKNVDSKSSVARRHDRSRPVRRPRRTVIGPQLRATLDGLPVAPDVKQSIDDVLHSREYPEFMSKSGTLVANTIWKTIPKRRRDILTARHPLDGPSAPAVLHFDMLLITCSDSNQQRQFFMYHRRLEWNTYFVPFRQRQVGEEAARNMLNAQLIAPYLSLQPNQVQVEPLKGKFAISLKPRPETDDLKLYVFEFNSVKIDADVKNLTHLARLPSAVGPGTNSHWKTVESLRHDARAMKVNGDVILYIRDTFGNSLHSLEPSFPGRFICEHEKRGDN